MSIPLKETLYDEVILTKTMHHIFLNLFQEHIHTQCTVGKIFFDTLLILYVCPLTRNDQSIILMVGLFDTEKQLKKYLSYKLICILMIEISI